MRFHSVKNKYLVLKDDYFRIPIFLCFNFLNPYTNTFNLLTSSTSSHWIIGKHMQICEYTRNPLFMFTTFWGVTCFTIKLHLNLFFMQCTKQSLYMNTMLWYLMLTWTILMWYVLVISSHEPPFDMYSAIGVTHRPP